MLELASPLNKATHRNPLFYGGFAVVSVALGLMASAGLKIGYTIGLLALLCLAGFLFVRLLAGAEDKALLRIILIALVVRVAMAVFFHYSNIVEESDALLYHSQASNFSLVLLGKTPLDQTVTAHAFGYVYLSAFIYAGFVPSSLVLKVLNCFIGVASSVFVYKIALMIWKERGTALMAAVLFLFLPGIMVWSTANAKDPLINLLILIALWRMVLIRERGRKVSDLIIVALCIGGLWTTRFYMTFLILPLSVYSLGAGRKKSIVYLSILLLIAILLLNYAFIGKKILGVEIGLQEVDRRLYSFTKAGGAATGAYQDVSNLPGAISFLPRGMVLFLFSPFPWSTPTSIWYTFAIIEMVFIYLLWAFILIGIFSAIKRKLRGGDILLIYSIGSILVFSLMVGNIGTFYRSRTSVMMVLLIFAAVGLSRVFRKEAVSAAVEEGMTEESMIPAEEG